MTIVAFFDYECPFCSRVQKTLEKLSDQLEETPYWDSLEDIAAWRADPAHRLAQAQGREQWYADYRVQIVKIEREYGTL